MILTPKEKAKELVDRFGKKVGKELKNGSFRYNIEIAKQCAIIAVDEILNGSRLFYIEDYDYWQEVKQEIKLL